MQPPRALLSVSQPRSFRVVLSPETFPHIEANSTATFILQKDDYLLDQSVAIRNDAVGGKDGQ